MDAEKHTKEHDEPEAHSKKGEKAGVAPLVAFAAADIAVVVDFACIVGYRRQTGGRATLGDGAKTYPTGGIPMPAISAFGMTRNLDAIEFTGVNGLTTDARLSWDKNAGKLQMFGDLNATTGALSPELAATVAPAARTYTWIAWGW